MKRTFLRLWAVFLSLILVLSGIPIISVFAVDIWDGTVATEYSGGTGTQADPFLIADGSQLAFLAQQVNANSTYSTAKHFKLTANIVLNDAAVFTTVSGGKITGIAASATPNLWTAIGIDASKPFFGSFDGDGYSVSGMYVTYTETPQRYNGLFGKIGLYANVTNLSVENSYINCIKNCAAVVAFAENAEVTFCTSDATVIGGIQSGGVIGKAIGGVVRNCTNEGFVDGTVSYCGGVIGYDEALFTTDCVNNGTVTGAGIYTGGIVGYVANNPVYDCINNGDVTSTAEIVGGICGATYNSSVSTNFNYGNVTGPKNVGGVVGKVIGENGSVINNVNRGAVICAGDYAGGVTGYGDSFFCVNDVQASVSGVSNVGGVTGCGIAIYGCNNGSVTGTGSNIGGIVGKSEYAIKYSYNTGTISAPAYGTIVGTGTAEYCYYLDTTGDYGIGDGSTVGATALTLAEMSMQESYVGWNFNERWCFVDGEHYPRLVMNHMTGGTVQADSGFASGRGLESDPYVIETIGQLAYLAQQVNNGNTYANTFFVLNNDIRSNTFGENWGLTAVSWVPIGNRYNMFHGHFDGQGHTVSGIYINRASYEQGLFGVTDIGCIENLTVADSHIFGSVAIGGIVGNALASSIHKCISSATVSGCTYVGGIIGYSTSASDKEHPFNYNRNTGNVTALGNYVGGVVGYSKYHISEAINYGNVLGRNYVGGITGYGGAMESYNAGTVTANLGSAGGISGYCDSTKLSGCYSSGYVSAANGIESPISPNAITTFCYYLEGTCDTPGDYGTKMLTDREMRLQESFKGFDFYSSWEFNNSGNYPYPLLVWDHDIFENAAVWDGSVATGYDSGAGTSTNPYIIATAEQLAYFASQVNAGNKYSKKYFALANDIILTDITVPNWEYTAVEWTPIGTSASKCFSGIFNGNDYSIKGLMMDKNINYYGLFGYIKSATIMNLHIDGMFVRGAKYVGGIAGIAASSSSIKYCSVNGVVANGYSGTTANDTVGGIVGQLTGSSINTCTSAGAVAGNNAGGIVGKASSSTIVYCSSSASVYCLSMYVGGIVGYMTSGSNADTCDFTGEVYGVKSGGIVGYLEKSFLSMCTNDGAVVDNGVDSTVGGIVGVAVGIATSPSAIIECINDGPVSGYMYIGGIAGRLDRYSDITGCTNTAEINGTTNVGGISGYSETTSSIYSSINSGIVSGDTYSGGIVGSHRSTVSVCENSGVVLGSSDATGGITGIVSGSSTTEDCLNTGIVIGGAESGGITGESQTAYVSRSVNYGTVTGTQNVSAIAGKTTDSEYTDNYYTIDSIAGSGSEKTAGVKGLTVDEASLQESYEGLDFDSTWTMKNGAATLQMGVTAVDIPNTLTVDCGKTSVINLTILPESAEYLSMYWESSDESIATVDENGTVTGVSLGEAEIKVTLETDYSVYTDICTLTVECLTHEATEIIPAVASTCTSSGLTEGKRCLDCGNIITTQQIIPASAHSLERDTQRDKAATCEQNGIEGYICTVCNQAQDKIIPAIGHSYGEWLSNGSGKHTRVCANDSTHVETADCTFEDVIIPSTCTSPGYTMHTCPDCAYSFSDTYVAALTHDYTNWSSNADGTHNGVCSRDSSHTVTVPCEYLTTVISATCDTGGFVENICKKCAYETTEYTSQALGHNYGNITSNGDGTHTMVCTRDNSHTKLEDCVFSIVVTPPTCNEQGYTSYICDACGYSYQTDYTQAVGHDWSIYETNSDNTHTVICANDPTHTKIEDCYDPDPKEVDDSCNEGIKTLTNCIYCGFTTVYIHEGTQTGHEYLRDESRDTAPTQDNPGTEAYTCTSCGGYNDIVIPALSTWHTAISEISVSSDKELYCTGDSTVLEAEITPANASYKSVIWSSSEPSVASVNENGEVTWHSRGKVTFTATSTDPYAPASGSLTIAGGYSYPTYTVNFKLVNQGLYAVNGINYDIPASLTFRAGEDIVFAVYDSDVSVEGAQAEIIQQDAYRISDIHGNAVVTITPEVIELPTTPAEPAANNNDNFFAKIAEFFKKLFSMIAALFGG